MKLGDSIFENALTDEILRLCQKLDIRYLTILEREESIEKLEKLVEKRNRLRETLNERFKEE